MLTPEAIRKVRDLFLSSRRRATGVFVGEFESAFRGSGIRFEEFREYEPGDDIRRIDWNVTARFDKPFIKVFREERERTVFILIDVSASTEFGPNRSKKETIAEAAGLLGYAAWRGGDRVGFAAFSDKIQTYIPPGKGEGHVWRMLSTLTTLPPASPKTDIAAALRFIREIAKRRATVILISDFLDTGFERELAGLSRRHELVCLKVDDPLEKELPPGILTVFSDAEAPGYSSIADLGSRSARKNWLKKREEATAKYNDMLKRRKIDHLELSTRDDIAESLRAYFIKREQRR